jgi:hypothetical protein
MNQSQIYFPLINDFDFKYYKENNIDLKYLNTDKQLYKHWYTYGCHENRKIKTIGIGGHGHGSRDGHGHGQLLIYNLPKDYHKPKLNLNIKGQNQTLSLKLNQTQSLKEIYPYDVKRQLIIMLYLFNNNFLDYYINLITDFNTRYSNFDIYLGTNDPNKDIINKIMKFKNTNNQIHIITTENRGGDIGGFLQIIKYMLDKSESKYLDIPYKYVIYGHSKTDNKWRINMCQSIFNYDYRLLLEKPKNINMIGSKRWMRPFFDDGKTKYNEHLLNLYKYYEIDGKNKEWQFVGGTIMTLSIDVLIYIYEHNITEVYNLLNYKNSLDNSWLKEIQNKKKNPKDALNDLYYRNTYGKSLLSDYMIEHTYERMIGLIVKNLGGLVITN